MGKQELQPTDDRSRLRMARPQAVAALEVQITKGQELLGWQPGTTGQYTKEIRAQQDLLDAAERYHTFNVRMLERMFTTNAELARYLTGTRVRLSAGPYQKAIQQLSGRVNELKAIREAIEIYEEVSGTAIDQAGYDSKKVFVVHGRDPLAKEQVENFLRMVDLDPIVLHREVSGGGTILQKIQRLSYVDGAEEGEARRIGFAVVLLTPDDVGALKDDFNARPDGALRPRARQNVWFELGYFLALLGEKRVRALRKGDVEMVSDFPNIWVDMDERGAWRTELAREIAGEGLDISSDKVK